jgi:hypothetical protein
MEQIQVDLNREKFDFNAQMLNYLVKIACDPEIQFSEINHWHSSHPYYRLNNYRGIQISQVLGIYLFFNKDYLSQFDNIIEIGTYNGGLSSYIFDNKKPGAYFISYDIDPSLNLTKREDIRFFIGDCFDPLPSFKISGLIDKPGRILIICDGGNKTKEFNTFSKHLKKGDIIILHDYKQDQESWDEYTTYWQWPYGFETQWDEIKDAVSKNGLEPFDNKRANFFLWGSFIKK